MGTPATQRLIERREALLARFAALGTAEQRLQALIDDARTRAPLPDDQKIDANLVPGCVANVWFVATMEAGCCRFSCDSESLVSKGLACLLCDLYSESTPQAIIAFPPLFLGEAGLAAALTANRRHAVSRIWLMIQGFAHDHAEAPDEGA